MISTAQYLEEKRKRDDDIFWMFMLALLLWIVGASTGFILFVEVLFYLFCLN